MHAARRARHEMAALLLEFGADPSAVDWEGVSVVGHVRDRPGAEARQASPGIQGKRRSRNGE